MVTHSFNCRELGAKAAGLEDEVYAKQTDLAFDQLKKIMLAGAGVGAAYRGASGLLGLLQHNAKPEVSSAVSANVVPMRILRPHSEERKIAADTAPATPAELGPYSTVPWAMPLHFLGGIGSMYAGHKLMDYLLDKRRQKGMQDEVDQAKAKFESALSGAPGEKMAEDDRMVKMSKQLDEIFDLMEKQSLPTKEWLTGALATAAIPVLLASGAAGYQLAKGHRESTALEAAAKERKRRLQQAVPPLVVSEPAEA